MILAPLIATAWLDRASAQFPSLPGGHIVQTGQWFPRSGTVLWWHPSPSRSSRSARADL